jgi:hypothetical protein
MDEVLAVLHRLEARLDAAERRPAATLPGPPAPLDPAVPPPSPAVVPGPPDGDGRQPVPR